MLPGALNRGQFLGFDVQNPKVMKRHQKYGASMKKKNILIISQMMLILIAFATATIAQANPLPEPHADTGSGSSVYNMIKFVDFNTDSGFNIWVPANKVCKDKSEQLHPISYWGQNIQSCVDKFLRIESQPFENLTDFCHFLVNASMSPKISILVNQSEQAHDAINEDIAFNQIHESQTECEGEAFTLAQIFTDQITGQSYADQYLIPTIGKFVDTINGTILQKEVNFRRWKSWVLNSQQRSVRCFNLNLYPILYHLDTRGRVNSVEHFEFPACGEH